MEQNHPVTDKNKYFCKFLTRYYNMADIIKDEIVLNDDELICVLTGDKKKANAKEQMLQSIILQMLILPYSVLEQLKSQRIWSAFASYVILK